MPTEVISNFSQQLPLYIFSVFSGAQTVGLFNRSRQILALPLNFVSSSIAEVYKQKSSELFRNNPGELRRLFLKTITYLAAVSIIPFLIIALFSPALFEIAFGASWRDAGVYAQCLVLMYFLRFVVSPTTFNFYLVGKQKLDFVLHIVVSLITSAAIYTGFELFNEEIPALLFFSSAYSVVYIVYGFLSYRFTIIDSR
jgi:O-antigen/teichoic acid export membrane protein